MCQDTVPTAWLVPMQFGTHAVCLFCMIACKWRSIAHFELFKTNGVSLESYRVEQTIFSTDINGNSQPNEKLTVIYTTCRV